MIPDEIHNVEFISPMSPANDDPGFSLLVTEDEINGGSDTEYNAGNGMEQNEGTQNDAPQVMTDTPIRKRVEF